MNKIEIGRNYILGEGYEPILCLDFDKFSAWFQRNHLLRIIGKTPLGPGVYISTVFLGIDHGVNVNKPILWESMIVGDKKLDDEIGYVRYSTYKEAIEGHMKLVDELRERVRNKPMAKIYTIHKDLST